MSPRFRINPSIVHPTHVVDSNIWMCRDSTRLVDEMVVLRVPIVISEAQINEIVSKKKRHPSSSGENKAARHALRRIEDAQIRVNLRIKPSEIRYGDAALLRMVAELLDQGHKINFLSHDVELRIRMRALRRLNSDLHVWTPTGNSQGCTSFRPFHHQFN